jgi:DNA polymerase-3 subunit alpha
VASSGGPRAAADRLQNLLSVYRAGPADGASPVRLKYRNGQAEADLPLGDSWCVRIDDKLIESLREWLSTESVEVIYS